MRGPDDGQMRVRLQEGSGIRLADLRDRLRKALPERLIPWMTAELERYGIPAEEAKALAEKITFGFEPGDIVSEVMSFGSPTPVEVMVVGPDLAKVRKHALERARRNEGDFLSPRRATLPATRLSDRAAWRSIARKRA